MHQPGFEIWRLIDHLLLIKDGNQLYSGRKDCTLQYFSSLGYDKKANFNPFDFIIETAVDNNLKSFSLELEQPKTDMHVKEDSRHRYIYQETLCLIKREGLRIARNKELFTLKLAQSIIISFIFGFFFNQIGYSESLVDYVGNLNGLFYNNTTNFFINALFLVIMSMNDTKRKLKKERQSRMYSLYSFYLALLVDYAFYGLIQSVIVGTVMYYSMGLYTDLFHLTLYCAVLFFVFMQGTTFSIALSSFLPERLSLILGPTAFVIFMLGSGFFKRNDAFNPHNKWMNTLSPFKYDIELFIRIVEGYNELTGKVAAELAYDSGVSTCLNFLLGFVGVSVVIGFLGLKRVY